MLCLTLGSHIHILCGPLKFIGCCACISAKKKKREVVHAPFKKRGRREIAWPFWPCDFPAVPTSANMLCTEMRGGAIQNEWQPWASPKSSAIWLRVQKQMRFLHPQKCKPSLRPLSQGIVCFDRLHLLSRDCSVEPRWACRWQVCLCSLCWDGPVRTPLTSMGDRIKTDCLSVFIRSTGQMETRCFYPSGFSGSDVSGHVTADIHRSIDLHGASVRTVRPCERGLNVCSVGSFIRIGCQMQPKRYVHYFQ